MSMKITEYKVEPGEIHVSGGRLLYNKVTPVFKDLEFYPDNVPGSRFLYEDYSSMLKPGDIFYEIALIEVEKSCRRKGIGTRLVKEFFAKCHPNSVVLEAGITSKERYEKLEAADKVMEYIYNNIVPFYKKLGFTDVNNTIFLFENHVPMLWPIEKANEAKETAEKFRHKMLATETNLF